MFVERIAERAFQNDVVRTGSRGYYLAICMSEMWGNQSVVTVVERCLHTPAGEHTTMQTAAFGTLDANPRPPTVRHLWGSMVHNGRRDNGLTRGLTMAGLQARQWLDHKPAVVHHWLSERTQPLLSVGPARFKCHVVLRA